MFHASNEQAKPIAKVKSIGLPATTSALMLSLNPLTKQLTWRVDVSDPPTMVSKCSNFAL